MYIEPQSLAAIEAFEIPRDVSAKALRCGPVYTMMSNKYGLESLTELRGGWQPYGSNMESYVPKALLMGDSIRAARLISGYLDPWTKPFPPRYNDTCINSNLIWTLK